MFSFVAESVGADWFETRLEFAGGKIEEGTLAGKSGIPYAGIGIDGAGTGLRRTGMRTSMAHAEIGHLIF